MLMEMSLRTTDPVFPGFGGVVWPCAGDSVFPS